VRVVEGHGHVVWSERRDQVAKHEQFREVGEHTNFAPPFGVDEPHPPMARSIVDHEMVNDAASVDANLARRVQHLEKRVAHRSVVASHQ